VARIGRNDTCPCGSGRKVKHCCGTDGAARLLRRAVEAVEEAYTLPVHFPRLRARGAAFEAWAAACAARGLDEGTVLDGVALLEPTEHARIVRECREEATAWAEIVAEVGDEPAAEAALVAGAVVAAVMERMPPSERMLAFIDERPTPGPACTLLGVVRPEDLWSILESARLDEELVRLDEGLGEEVFEQAFDGLVADFARRHWSDRHEERLAELVARCRALLPLDGFPAASAELEAACDAFERDPAVREELAALLLTESLERIDAGRASGDAFADAA
jgi:hypothetical protein